MHFKWLLRGGEAGGRLARPAVHPTWLARPAGPIVRLAGWSGRPGWPGQPGQQAGQAAGPAEREGERLRGCKGNGEWDQGAWNGRVVVVWNGWARRHAVIARIDAAWEVQRGM